MKIAYRLRKQQTHFRDLNYALWCKLQRKQKQKKNEMELTTVKMT